MTLDEQAAWQRTALALAETQAARDDDAEGVAAAALVAGGATLTDVWVEAMCDSACRCAESGPICDEPRLRAVSRRRH
jgi:hypothetical protein